MRGTRDYIRRTFTGEHEIVSLTGNFSELEGRPSPHCHLIIAGDDWYSFAEGRIGRGTRPS